MFHKVSINNKSEIPSAHHIHFCHAVFQVVLHVHANLSWTTYIYILLFNYQHFINGRQRSVYFRSHTYNCHWRFRLDVWQWWRNHTGSVRESDRSGFSPQRPGWHGFYLFAALFEGGINSSLLIIAVMSKWKMYVFVWNREGINVIYGYNQTRYFCEW